jgi:hypothetical protein
MAFGSFSSCAVGDIGEADGAGVVDEVRGDTVLRLTTCCFGFCGRATCFGASTRTLGSEVVAPPEGVAVFAIAVPLTPHSSGAIDKIATVRLATKTDENLIALSSHMLGQPIPSQTPGYHGLMTVWGQNAKYSVRVNVFSLASKLGHRSTQPALRLSAKNGHRCQLILSEMSDAQTATPNKIDLSPPVPQSEIRHGRSRDGASR